MNQIAPNKRPANSRGASKPSRKRQEAARSEAAKRGTGALWVVIAITLFTLAYGGILLLKI